MNYVSFLQFEVDTHGTVTTVCRRMIGVQRVYCKCIGPSASIIAPSDRDHGVLEVRTAAAAAAKAVRHRGGGDATRAGPHKRACLGALHCDLCLHDVDGSDAVPEWRERATGRVGARDDDAHHGAGLLEPERDCDYLPLRLWRPSLEWRWEDREPGQPGRGDAVAHRDGD